MRIKKGASIAGLKIEMRKVLIAADKVYKEAGKELVITSGLEGEHSAGSLHYYGYAVDIRHNFFSEAEKSEVHRALIKALPSSKYDVVWEKTHFHIEYDPDSGWD